MLKLKMLTSMCGPAMSLVPGDPYECEAGEAERLIAAGFAVRDETAEEQAEREAAEKEAAEKEAAEKAQQGEAKTATAAKSTTKKPAAKKA